MEEIGVGIQYRDVAPGRRGGGEKGAGFNAVRRHLVTGAAQALYAFYGDGAGACALYSRPHAGQQPGQVADFRLHGAVVQHGGSLGQGGGHDQVLGGGHRGNIKGEVRAAQAPGLGLDVARLDSDLGSQRLQAGDMLVHRP